MEEELQKRNTDCVYFLASPLTCKKGSECEYRHSEVARLNPRDCWYWLSGNCLNGSCAFRHPPLDGRPETPTEPTPNQPYQSALPATKTNVPCYYFYNGFCNKGEKCTFLHGPVNSMPTWKSSNTGSVNPNGPSMEKKTSAGSDTGSAPVVMNANSFPGGRQQGAASRRKPDPEIHQSDTCTAEKQNESPLTPESPFDDVAAGRSNSVLVTAGSFQRRSHTSSPGFDVLVDDDSEALVHEEDYEYVLDDDREGREFNGNRYDYDENAEETDPAYPGLSALYEKEGRDYEDRVGAAHDADFVRKGAANSRGSVLDRIEPRKRKFFPRGLANNSQDGVDLRHLLKRRRMVDDHSRNYSSRSLESSRLVSRSRERPRSQGEHQLHGRRASEHDNGFSRSRVEDERSRRPHFDRSRLQEKPTHSLSDVPGKAAPRYRSYADETTIFSGPKTLAQIREEKRARGNREPSESTFEDEIVQEEFQRPKTLDEILEEKRRLRSQVDGSNDIN